MPGMGIEYSLWVSSGPPQPTPLPLQWAAVHSRLLECKGLESERIIPKK